MIKRLAALTIGTVLAVLAVAPTAQASPQQACTGSFALSGFGVATVRAADASTCEAPPTYLGTFPTSPRAVSQALMAARPGYQSITMFATLGGQLQHITTDKRIVNGVPQYHTARSSCGTGWGSMRVLLTSRISQSQPMLYAVHDSGSLYRYEILGTSPCRLRSTGSVALAGLKAIAIIGEQPDKDVFLITTTSGILSVLRVPRTAAMTATSSRIRSRSWQVFDTILFKSGVGSGVVNELVGIKATTHRWYHYMLEDATKGLSTVIVADGAVDAALVGTPVFQGTTGARLTGG